VIINFNFDFFLYIYSAFEILSVSTYGVTVEKLISVAPTELVTLQGTERVWKRLAVEASYEAAAKDQEAEVDAVRQEEALLIPRNLDYTS
jgi:tRNA U34 5-carboxymethylaminomethyl modifying enzyme MnmG/GidA